MSHLFTTLRHPVERLLEAEYFLVRLPGAHSLEFQALLNAFLSASRSVTFLLQSSMARVLGFDEWYLTRQQEMSADKAMRFFLNLRNISQKQGPVSYVGGGLWGGGTTYQFVAGHVAVPDQLKGRNVAECCGEQVSKLAILLLAYREAFPFHACPGRAFTEEGMTALGYTMNDVEESLGLPTGYVTLVDIPIREKLRILSREIEPLDVKSLERLSRREFKRDQEDLALPIAPVSIPILDGYIAAEVERRSGEAMHHPRDNFLAAVARRIMEMDETAHSGPPAKPLGPEGS